MFSYVQGFIVQEVNFFMKIWLVIILKSYTCAANKSFEKKKKPKLEFKILLFRLKINLWFFKIT